MEKARLSIQMFGRILFAQSTEMIDPHLSGGLPANLAADDPSLSFTMKGLDVNMAAYMAELSYLANPMSSHMQVAEMHNQSVNSMALASARMSDHAVGILAMMCACSIYITCQALDLRALHRDFVSKLDCIFTSTTAEIFHSLNPEELRAVQSALKAHVAPSWGSTGKLDLLNRCELVVSTALPIVAAVTTGRSVADLIRWKEQTTRKVYAEWTHTSKSFSSSPHTAQLLGRGSRTLYNFVRKELEVPFHEGFIEHPALNDTEHRGRSKKTIGAWVSIIHTSLKNGVLFGELKSCIEDLQK